MDFSTISVDQRTPLSALLAMRSQRCFVRCRALAVPASHDSEIRHILLTFQHLRTTFRHHTG
ncbi:uncharacterized protein SCHCODRAFT_02612812 [Schizophyllum commune H4-8]|uniref:uncharacterized protein n=1 Tax=Schizophyllum commune (strain H4-8 / FGSC 9210) TaxID=578458 RepID=UPI00216074D9|nr:uncharacterized protein SCHCODRAFT_02612812 [Schizophyllum commune H4-8]KAI5898671.1 hypothetical protein SCHCODRAFT_02612812 [Schizophyllum commune H4-8]